MPASAHFFVPVLFEGTRFERHAWFQHARFDTKASFDRAQFAGVLNFAGAVLPADSDMLDTIAALEKRPANRGP